MNQLPCQGDTVGLAVVERPNSPLRKGTGDEAGEANAIGGGRAGAGARGMRESVDAAPLRLTLLGGFTLMCQAKPVPLPLSAQRLLAYLALQRQPLLRAHIAGRLWPESTEAHAFASLRSALWRLRQAGLPLVTVTSTHLLLTDAVMVDVSEVVATVDRLTERSQPCLAADLDVAGLTGELLPDWWDDWVFFDRERLRQRCLYGLEALCERLLALGRYDQAVEAGLAAVRIEPLRESTHRALIAVHLAEGNHGEALRQYHWYRRLVREELRIEPSPQITRLFEGLERAV